MSTARFAALFSLIITTPSFAFDKIQFNANLPPDCTADSLVWGIMQNGLELGRGKVSMQSVLSSGNFLATAAADVNLQHGAVTAYLCLNNDELGSYIPSVGDTFQLVTIANVDGDTAHALLSENKWHKRQLCPGGKLLTIHYHRFNKDYDNASLWTWDEHRTRTPEQNEIYPVGVDSFGLVFQLDTGLYGRPGDTVGLLPRLNADWQMKDGGDRNWSPDMGYEIYLVQEQNQLYREVPDVSPKVRAVTLDADRHLTVRFSHRLPTSDWTPDKFRISTSAGHELPVKAVHPFAHRGDQCAVYSIETTEPFEYPRKTYALDIEGYGTHNVRIGHILTTGTRFYDADAKLGANYTSSGTTFAVFAPGALLARVVVADSIEGQTGIAEHDMSVNDHGVWSAHVEGDLQGKYYAYKLSGIGFDPDREITDAYATCTQARYTRSLIVDMEQTNPPGFKEYSYNGPMSAADAIVYEMHIRDFTIAADSGVSPGNKGKYLGVTESGTTLPDESAVKTGIDHIVELGVTHVQIMPLQDFDNGETDLDAYNWGYMPVHFNSPEGWYASDRMGPCRIREIKSAIKAFHDRGVGVIMDVVYNHTAGHAPFDSLVPGYYFRLTNAGNYSNGSGCGNEFASEHPMARKYILDSVRYWVEEYKIDGFRFDLMGLIDIETMKQIKHELAAIHPGILIYGEPWAAGPTPLKPITDKSQVRATGIGAFNDSFRDAVKGGRDGGAPGFIQVGDSVDGVVKGLMGGIHDWSHDPVDAISYFEAHDNLTAWDKLIQSTGQASEETRKQMIRFGALTLFTAQGMSFMHSGQEFCRTKKGSSNSYNLPDDINRLEWSRKKDYRDVFEYHKGMIALRKAHPAFRLRMRSEVEQRVHFRTPPDHRCIVYHIHGQSLPGESAEWILVLLNGATESKTFELPEGEWPIYANAEKAGLDVLGTAQDRVELPPHSGIILIK